jgi:hypothetical protein
VSLFCLSGPTANREGAASPPFFGQGRDSASDAELPVLEFQRSPTIPARDTRIGPPGHCNAVTRCFVRQVIQRVKISDGHAHAQILVRENIQSSQGEDQKHLRSPDADAFDLNQSLNDFLIAQACEPIKSQIAAPDLLCQSEQIACLLSGNANPTQLSRP